jgi:hypothetical protein
MPVLSRFYGIVVFMNYRDHDPPHVHARYGDHEVIIEIESGLVVGQFPRRALRLLTEWTELHEAELAANWKRARAHRPLQPIEPLP